MSKGSITRLQDSKIASNRQISKEGKESVYTILPIKDY